MIYCRPTGEIVDLGKEVAVRSRLVEGAVSGYATLIDRGQLEVHCVPLAAWIFGKCPRLSLSLRDQPTGVRSLFVSLHVTRPGYWEPELIDRSRCSLH